MKRRWRQPGHPKHERAPFSSEQIDAVWEYKLEECPDCGGALKHAQRPAHMVQQMELVDKPVASKNTAP